MKSLKVAGTTNRYKKAVWGKYRQMRKGSLKDGNTNEQSKAIQS